MKDIEFMLVTTAEGPDHVFRSGGAGRFTINEMLRPIEVRFYQCKVNYLPAFVTYSFDRLSDGAIEAEAARYADVVLAPSIVEPK